MMTTKSFTSINTHLQSTYALLIYFIAFMLAQEFKVEITLLNITITAVIATLTTLLVRPFIARTLTITDTEIIEHNEKTKKIYWKMQWDDIEEVRLIYLPMNQYILRIKNSNKTKDLILGSWIPNKPKRDFQTIREILFSRNTSPENMELYQSINQFKNIISDEESKESASIQDQSMDLGAPAGYMAYTALGFVCVTVAMLFISKSHILEPGLIDAIAWGTTFFVFLICSYITIKSKKIHGSIITGLLLTACSYALSHTTLKTINVLWGEEHIKTFELTKKSGDYQIWTAENNLELKIYAEINQVKYLYLHTDIQLPVHVGPFDMISIQHPEIRKALIK